MLGGDAKPTRAPRETRKRNSVAKERVERDEEDLVRLYLTDIGQYPLLTKDDEVRLAQAIEAGNEARTELDAGGKEVTPARKRELRRTAREGENAERTERFTGKFRRSISLPTRVDAGKVSAIYKDGILTVTLPKAEEAKPKKVEVNVQ